MSAEPAEAVPETMRALVLRGPDDWAVETVARPDVDDVENVLCRVRAATICGTDPKIMGGTVDRWPPRYPFVPGHEWAGEVVAVGEGVDRVGPGDRVFGETHSGCGTCERCRAGEYNLCLNYGDDDAGHRQTGHTMDGAFAEYVTVPADTLYGFDESISWAEGALLDTNAIALGCSTKGGISPGDTVAVVGTGTVGLLLVQHARLLGASDVVAVGNPQRNRLAAELGADHTVPYTDDVVEQVLAYTDGVGVDVTLEAAGAPEVYRQAVAFTRKGGTISADGTPDDDVVDVPIQDLVQHQITLRGARAHANLAERSERTVRTGQVDVSALVTHEFPFESFAEAYETFTARRDGAIKVALEL